MITRPHCQGYKIGGGRLITLWQRSVKSIYSLATEKNAHLLTIFSEETGMAGNSVGFVKP